MSHEFLQKNQIEIKNSEKDKLFEIRTEIAKYMALLEEIKVLLKSTGWEHKEVLKLFYEKK